MRLCKNLFGIWSKRLRRYVVVEERVIRDYEGPVAYAFGGGGGGGTETVPTGPFGPQIPFITSLFQEAANIFQQGPPQFPQFPTVAEPGADLLASQAGISDIVSGNAGSAQTASDLALSAATGQDAFGGSGKGASSESPLPPNAISDVANPLSGVLGGSLQQLLLGSQNPLKEQGQATSPGATGAINAATGGAQAPPPGFNPAGAPTLGPAGIDINQILQANLGGSGLNPFIGETVDAATRGLVNNFQRNVIPSIGDAASQAGQVGGSRQGIAQGIAAGDLQQNIADVTAQLFAQGFDRNVGVQQNALSQVGGAQTAQGQFELGAGGLNEQIRNAILGQGLQGAELSQSGLGQGLGLGTSSLSTGTSQIGNLLQAGNAQGLEQFFGGLGLLPALQGNQLAQQGALNQSGLQQFGFDQAGIDAAIQEFFFNEFGPINALTQFQNFVSGPFGSSVGGAAENTAFPGAGTGFDSIFPPGTNDPNANTFDGGTNTGGTKGGGGLFDGGGGGGGGGTVDPARGGQGGGSQSLTAPTTDIFGGQSKGGTTAVAPPPAIPPPIQVPPTPPPSPLPIPI